MKKLVYFVIPFKAFGSMIFAGLMILYMVSGVLFSIVTGEAFAYEIPFVFVFQGLLLASLISLIWGVLFNDTIIRKWRYFSRLIVFCISLMVLLAICFMTFMAIPTDWANLWMITTGCVGIFVIVLSIITEVYYKVTGKRYTEILNHYKADIS